MYFELAKLNNEDIYVQRISVQLLIHEMVLKYTSPILQNIQKLLTECGFILYTVTL